MENENRNKTDWLKELANDESLWEERVYEEMPAVIAYEYRRLHEMAAEGNVYGTMLQMKDVCEIILKYPMILGLCILKEDNNPEDVAFYREVISLIFSDVPMSLGKWVDKVIRLKKRQLPKILFQILDRTLELFSQEIGGYADIPNWRNLTIGHGVLRSEDNIGLQTEMKTLLLLLKCYFNGGILDEYTHIVLTQGTTPLIGESATKLQSNEPFVLRIKQNGQKSASIGALEYIFPSDHKIYFFDSYRKPKTTFLDYVEGIPLFVKHGFFNEFYEELKKSDMISKKTAEMVKSSDTYLTKATNKLMDELEKPPIFEPPLYIYNWFFDQIRQNINGCFILKLGRGLGKSALASNMSTNHIEASCVVRTYHCFRTQIRTADDFLTKIKRIFLDTGKSSDEIEDIQGLHEYTDIKRQDWDAQATANLLNFLAAFYQKEKGIKKLVLVIDGIDEIVDFKMFDLFPKQGDLAEGVYVLYTTRPDTENEIADASLRMKIQSMDIDEDKCCSENSEEHQKVVLAYAQKEMQKTYHRDASSTEYIELAKKADYNFLKLRVLIPVYCSSNTMDIASRPGGAVMFGEFLNFLEDNYGKKFFNNRVLPVLIALSIFYDGLTFDDLAHILEDRENRLLLAAALNDLKGVLSVDRSAKGNVYKLANEEYVQYINEEYGGDILSYKKKYTDDFSVMVAKIQDIFNTENIRDAYGLVKYNWDLRNDIKELFPAVFILRENLFQIIGTPHSFSTNSFGIFENEAEMVDFMEKYLLLNKCVGYTHAEMDRSVEIFDWMQQHLVDLANDAIGRKKIYDIGEKLLICFSNFYQIMFPFPRANDIDVFFEYAKNFYKVLCDMHVFSNSYKAFMMMTCLNLKIGINYDIFYNAIENVINKNEFHLFFEHEKEVFLSLSENELEIMDDILSRIPHMEKERAWINNLLLNMTIDSDGVWDYDTMKRIYDAIIAGGFFPAYIEHRSSTEEAEKETEKFHEVIAVLKENDRNKYRELFWKQSLYNLEWTPLCKDLGINSLERYEEAVYYYLEGCKRKKEELERFIDEETVIEDITSYANTISLYYAATFPDTSVDVNHVEDLNEFYSWMHFIESKEEFLKKYSECERVALVLSYRYRLGRKENIERVKKWLDEYQDTYAILDSKQYSWIYFNEYENYFNYMIETNRDKLYLDLRNNKLWVKIWKHITPYIDQYEDIRESIYPLPQPLMDLAQSYIYLVFTIRYAIEKGDSLIAKRFSLQYIKDICKYGYFDLGMRLYAWVECQKVLRKVGDSSVDCYEPIHRLEKEYELMKDNPELAHKYYINILALRLNESICAFMFGDYELIPTLEDKIKALVTDAKKETDRTHWQYIDEPQCKSISFQISVLNLIYKYVSGAILGHQFACEARTMIPDLREQFALDSEYGDMERKIHLVAQGLNAAESFFFSMFSCICKEVFSNEEYSQLCSKFDDYWHSFSFSSEGFSMNFSFDRSDWSFML